MMVPGFVAAASLYRSTRTYSSPRGRACALRGVVPADYVDAGCFDACYGNCNQDCFELTGSARGACLRSCARVAADCDTVCTRPGNPPPGPTPPPSIGFPGGISLRMLECTLCCTEGANSWFEQNVVASVCMQACLIFGCNR
jgi:hypothetical protein